MTYMEQMVQDIIEYIKEDELEVTAENREEVAERLNDELWIADSVTGNGSGSYYFSSYKAREQVLEHGYEYIPEAVAEFGIDSKEVAQRFIDGDWEYWDVTIRCYLLSEAIEEALDQLQ